MKFAHCLRSILLGFLVSVPALAAPVFGLKKGMKPSELTGLVPVEGRPHVYQTKTVPDNRGGFANYQLLFSEREGLYCVSALTDPIEFSEGDGYAVISPTYDAILTKLARNYGKGAPKGMDSLAFGWNRKNNPKLDKSIEQVVVDVVHPTAKTVAVQIEYRFANFAKGDRENSAL